MKKIKFILALLICTIVLFSGCRKTAACFTIESEDYLNPRYPIQFRNCSERADEYEWDFGDGQTSDLEEPSHTYLYPGSYEIKLTATKGKQINVLTKTLDLDYAFIDKIRIVSISPTKPNGDPWDPDGTGADVRIHARDINRPPGSSVFSTLIFENIVLPFEVAYSTLQIDPATILIVAEDINNPRPFDVDTIGRTTRILSDFADDKFERIELDDITFEFYMSQH